MEKGDMVGFMNNTAGFETIDLEGFPHSNVETPFDVPG